MSQARQEKKKKLEVKKERKKITVGQTEYLHGAISEMYKNFGNLLISVAQICHCIPSVSHSIVHSITRSKKLPMHFVFDVRATFAQFS